MASQQNGSQPPQQQSGGGGEKMETDQDEQLSEEILKMSAEDLRSRSHLLDNEIRIMRSEVSELFLSSFECFKISTRVERVFYVSNSYVSSSQQSVRAMMKGICFVYKYYATIHPSPGFS